MNLLHNTITTLAALAVAGTASAQSTQIPAPPQEQPLLVLNASLHPVSNDHPAVVNDGWVRFDAGRITAVGEGGPPKDMLEDATIIDAGGLPPYFQQCRSSFNAMLPNTVRQHKAQT